jgi:hypothetical protein
VPSVNPALLRATAELLLLLVLVFWIAGAWWVYRDARRRLDDWVLVAVAAAGATLFGLAGILVYQLVRPAETRADARERESLTRILARAPADCPACGAAADPAFLACPHCAARLKAACPECGRLAGLDWRFCAGCARALTPIVDAPAPAPARASTVARGRPGPRTVYAAAPWRRLVRLS